MGRAEELVAQFVAAGFRKLHLDCSMSCADDPSTLPEATVASRAARLCAAAERAWREHGGDAPAYVARDEVTERHHGTDLLGHGDGRLEQWQRHVHRLARRRPVHVETMKAENRAARTGDTTDRGRQPVHPRPAQRGVEPDIARAGR
jgi:hypothetical protein